MIRNEAINLKRKVSTFGVTERNSLHLVNIFREKLIEPKEVFCYKDKKNNIFCKLQATLEYICVNNVIGRVEDNL